MGFHCIACNSDKSISHRTKNAKAGAQAISRHKKIAPFIRENTKLLDTGSGGGEFTYIASRVGTTASGIDPSSGYFKFGKNHHSINVEQKQVSQLEGTQPNQIVIMFHVLEHLLNPLKVIRKVHQILNLRVFFCIEFAKIESKVTSTFNGFFNTHICYFTILSLIGSLKNNFSVEHIDNKDVVSLDCQKSNAKKLKRLSEYNPSAVNIVKSRLKCKNLKGYLSNGGLIKIFKKKPGSIEERYISHGKNSKMILESLFISEDLANDNQI